MKFEYAPGATPLDPDEIEGLIPKHITTQGQLNEWEQANILDGELWSSKKQYTGQEILTDEFVKMLHQRMFNNTWKWAGVFRRSNKNIGVTWEGISIQLKNLLDDALYQFDHNVFSQKEIAVRLHHRLVAIHCFPNGNGRHARLIADLFMGTCGETKFTWGRTSLIQANDTRKKYIDALRCADRMDYTDLINFVSS